MCHHYIIEIDPPLNLAEEFGTRSELYDTPFPFAGFYPLAMVPAIRLNKNDQRETVALEWGLLPHWWKPSERSKSRQAFQRKCFNARQETVDTKPTYRDAFKSRRCLLPATAFMEKGHYFHLQDKRPFAFAGLWQQWQADDQHVESCTLLTTEPNELVQSVDHHRMPVLLTDDTAYAHWLNPDHTERQALEHLFRPYDHAQMEHYKAKKE